MKDDTRQSCEILSKFDPTPKTMSHPNEPTLSKTQALKILTKIARTDATPAAERIAALGLLAKLQGWCVKRVEIVDSRADTAEPLKPDLVGAVV